MSVRDERDWILRAIAMAAVTVGRLRGRLVGGSAKDAADVVQAARDAQGELLGQHATLLRALDPNTAVQMLGADRLPAWADLLQVEADALRQAGKQDEAMVADVRALAIRSLAGKR